MSRPSSRPRRRGVGPAAAAAVLVVGLTGAFSAACSGSSDEQSSPTPTPSASGPATSAPVSTTAASPSADGVLRIGSLLPGTGSQASVGPAMARAAQAAIDDVNAAGGVNGVPVQYVAGDSGDVSTDTGAKTVGRLAQARVDAIVGPASAGVADAVADRVAAAGVVLVSPGNPLPVAPPGLRYVRTAPGDALRGKALAAEVLAGGARNVVLLARKDGFGDRLGAAVRAPLETGGAKVTVTPYNPEAEVYTADATSTAGVRPDAVVIVGYAEATQLVRALTKAGLAPRTVPTWLLTDRLDDSLAAAAAQPDLLTGLRGVAPAVELPPAFVARVAPGVTPAPKEIPFTAETYDAVVLTALAAVRAGNDDPAKFGSAYVDVSGGEAACTTLVACLAAAKTGRVSYQGVGGSYRIDATGTPTSARFAVRSFGADNRIDATKTVYRNVSA